MGGSSFFALHGQGFDRKVHVAFLVVGRLVSPLFILSVSRDSAQADLLLLLRDGRFSLSPFAHLLDSEYAILLRLLE